MFRFVSSNYKYLRINYRIKSYCSSAESSPEITVPSIELKDPYGILYYRLLQFFPKIATNKQPFVFVPMSFASKLSQHPPHLWLTVKPWNDQDLSYAKSFNAYTEGRLSEVENIQYISSLHPRIPVSEYTLEQLPVLLTYATIYSDLIQLFPTAIDHSNSTHWSILASEDPILSHYFVYVANHYGFSPSESIAILNCTSKAVSRFNDGKPPNNEDLKRQIIDKCTIFARQKRYPDDTKLNVVAIHSPRTISEASFLQTNFAVNQEKFRSFYVDLPTFDVSNPGHRSFTTLLKSLEDDYIPLANPSLGFVRRFGMNVLDTSQSKKAQFVLAIPRPSLDVDFSVIKAERQIIFAAGNFLYNRMQWLYPQVNRSIYTFEQWVKQFDPNQPIPDENDFRAKPFYKTLYIMDIAKIYAKDILGLYIKGKDESGYTIEQSVTLKKFGNGDPDYKISLSAITITLMEIMTRTYPESTVGIHNNFESWAIQNLQASEYDPIYYHTGKSEGWTEESLRNLVRLFHGKYITPSEYVKLLRECQQYRDKHHVYEDEL